MKAQSRLLKDLLIYIGMALLTIPSLMFTMSANGQRKDPVSYIEKYKLLAQQIEDSLGVPYEITLGQGILESSAGSSELADNACNHFGIKAGKDWSGGYYVYDDDQPKERFRAYGSEFASFWDHGIFLRTRAHYSFLFRLPPRDYKAWAKGLQKAGYATNRLYGAELIKVIEKHIVVGRKDQRVVLN